MKNGKAWGCVYDDGHSSQYGWIEPENALICDPRFTKKPTDVTYEGSPYLTELSDAKVVAVERLTTVNVLSKVKP